MRQNAKRRSRNNRFKDLYRDTRVSYERLIKAGDAKAAAEALPKLYSIIDTLDKKNLLHKNNAARKKSRFNRMLKEIASAPKKKS